MVLDDLGSRSPAAGRGRVEVLGPDHPGLGEVLSAISAGFGETDEVGAPRRTEDLRDRLASGALRVVGAFGRRRRPVGGGSHSPRGGVTELTGIAVLPRARRRGVGAAITATLVRGRRERGVVTVFLSAGSGRVADIYARVGFVRVGTACVAEAARTTAASSTCGPASRSSTVLRNERASGRAAALGGYAPAVVAGPGAGQHDAERAARPGPRLDLDVPVVRLDDRLA